MSHDVPVLISKQSGVSEVLTHALKCDFWDINEMANKIIAVLRHPPLASTLRQHGAFDVRRRTWVDAARQCAQVYDQTVTTMAVGV
jgi:glycosyltransferase involved in cell wall biosynthesis